MTGGCAKYMCWLACLCMVIAVLLAYSRPVTVRRSSADKPISVVTIHHELAIPERPDHYRPDVPLARDLQEILHTACAEYGVDYALALAVMETESGFDPDAVGPDGHDIGLYQIRSSNHAWLQGETGADPLTPDGNIKCGVWLIWYLLGRCDSTEAALTAYRYGHDNGTSGYANAVMEAAEKWR